MDPSKHSHRSAKATLQALRANAQELYGIIKDEEKAKLRRWEDEKPGLERTVASLNQTLDILKRDKKRVSAELLASKAKLDKTAAVLLSKDKQQKQQEQQQRENKPHSGAGQKAHSGAGAGQDQEVLDLQLHLVDLNNRVLEVDIALAEVNSILSSPSSRADEQEIEIYSTKLVVLQHTRRILLDEVTLLRSSIFRMESVAKYEAEKQQAEESGWAKLSMLEENTVKVALRLDRQKQALYFPTVKGYRYV